MGSQLYVTKQYKFGTGASWEGNRRSGVTDTVVYPPSYGLNGQRQGDEHPRLCPFGAWHHLPSSPNHKINKNLCGRDGRTICGPQCVPSTCVSL